MRKALPPMTEYAAEPKLGLRRERDRQKQSRLQMGVHRHTIGRWLAIHASSYPGGGGNTCCHPPGHCWTYG
jgi:hypothetical protein